MDSKLNLLYEDMNTVLENIVIANWTNTSSVNWASFGIHSVEDVIAFYDPDDKRHRFFRIWLSEASPDNRELGEYLAGELLKLGWEQVEIRMEW
jgi:hypothetical protein